MTLEGKSAIVTGAASGIGREIAATFARAGANVAIAVLNPDAANAAAAQIREQGGQALGVAMDVADEGAVDAGVASVVSQWGSVDILVSNAGIRIVHPIEQFSLAEWKKMLAIRAVTDRESRLVHGMSGDRSLPESDESPGRDIPLERAPTEFIDAPGIRFAYRRLGPRHGTPLLLLQHFTGTMDSWDPGVVNPLAQSRPVIVFDNTGVGQSSGKTPDNVGQMTTDAELFIGALGLDKVDLLGYSLGGFVAQALAARRPGLVRKLVLVATAPQGGEQHLLEVLAEARSHKDAADPRLPLFFTSSEASRAAGLAFLRRASVRTADRDPESGNAVGDPQAKALIDWCARRDPQHVVLKAIHQPVLIASGSKDTMFPVENAYVMFKYLDNAQLIVYPDSGHGVLFQYPELFVGHVDLFLDQ